MLTILAIGDPHFRVDNIPEVESFINRIKKLAASTAPDLIIILGDVLHTHERLHTIPLNKACEFIDEMRDIAPTFVLVGNHDYIQNQQFLTSNHWMNGLKEWNNVTIVDQIIHKVINEKHLVFCPYVPPGRFQEALDSYIISDKLDWKHADCIFAHQEFFGSKMGAWASVDGDKWPENYPNVVSGHIHERQMLQENIYYCGAAIQHAFGESDKNIIPILKWDDNSRQKYELKEVELDLPRKRIIYTNVQDIEEYELPQTEDKIKITLSGVYDEFKAFKKTKKYRELLKDGIKIVFKPKKIQNEKNEPSDETDFQKILSSLVLKEKNPQLFQLYELVINNKNILEDDIMFL